MSSRKSFLRWYNNKDVVEQLEPMLKMIAFYHEKDIQLLKLGCTLPNHANICLQKSTDANFYQFTEGYKDLSQKFRQDVVDGPSIVFIRKAAVDEILFESLQTYTNLLLGLMPANYVPTQCVNSCPPVFIRVGISIQKRVDSHLDKTKPGALKKWSCHISNEQEQNVKFEASLQQADSRKLNAPMLMGFGLLATICLKSWLAFTTSVPAKNFVTLSLKRKFNVVARRESSMH